MKNKYILSLLSSLLLIGLATSNVQAQSAFAGFYGQVSTGYENNQLTNISGNSVEIPSDGDNDNSSAPSQNFGGAPLVFSLGYYWQANSSWLLGIGADYSAISQTSSSWQSNVTNAAGSTGIAAGETNTYSGASMKLSNRFNLFVTPAYAIDKDKLVYLKAGYSQVTAQYNRPTSLTKAINGVSTSYAATNGNQSSNQGGYLVGLGYKQIITSGLYGFVEGNYMGYNAPSYKFTSVNASDTAHGSNTGQTRTVTANFASLNTYQLLIGVGYAF